MNSTRSWTVVPAYHGVHNQFVRIHSVMAEVAIPYDTERGSL